MYGDAVILDAGPGHRFDLTVRSLVVAPAAGIHGPRGGSHPPDLVLIDPGRRGWVGNAGVPVLQDVVHPDQVAGVGPFLLRIRDAASMPAGVERLRSGAGTATAAGRPPGSVVLDLGLDAAVSVQDAQDRLGATGYLVHLCHPVCVALDTVLGTPEALAVLAMSAGARLLRLSLGGTDVRTARRIADVTEALLTERVGIVR